MRKMLFFELGWSVGWSVGWSFFCKKTGLKHPLLPLF